MSLPTLEQDCTCANTACERHKNCAACVTFHQDKPKTAHCLRPDSIVPDGLKDRVHQRLAAAGIPCPCCGK